MMGSPKQPLFSPTEFRKLVLAASTMVILFSTAAWAFREMEGWPAESALTLAVIGTVVSLASLAVLVGRKHRIVWRDAAAPRSWWILIGAVIRDAFALFGALMMLSAFGVSFESPIELSVLTAVTIGGIALVGVARQRRRSVP